MQAEIIEVMHQQVQAIHRAVTGSDLPEAAPAEHASTDTASDEVITQRFAELDALVRSMPSVAGRIPPFAFTPAVDVIAGDDAVILEVAVCGVRREDIIVERIPDGLVIRGLRREGSAGRGRVFHAEIARGPFVRVIPLPFPIEGEPRIELEHGLLRIYVAAEAAQGGNGSRVDRVTNQGSEENKQ